MRRHEGLGRHSPGAQGPMAPGLLAFAALFRIAAAADPKLAAPVIVNGALVISNEDGVIYCLGAR